MEIKPKVIDLSHYDNVGPTPIASTLDGFRAVYNFGIRGIINKVTEGPGMVDKSFGWRRVAAEDAGLLYAAYHFLRPGNIRQQVDNFLEHSKPDNKLGLSLDHEDPKVPLASAREFLEILHEKTGQWASLYTGFLIKQQLTHDAEEIVFWSKIRLWLSHYSAHPTWPNIWKTPWLWQYTGDGIGPSPHNVPGISISGGLDINSFAGTNEELAKSWTQT